MTEKSIYFKSYFFALLGKEKYGANPQSHLPQAQDIIQKAERLLEFLGNRQKDGFSLDQFKTDYQYYCRDLLDLMDQGFKEQMPKDPWFYRRFRIAIYLMHHNRRYYYSFEEVQEIVIWSGQDRSLKIVYEWSLLIMYRADKSTNYRQTLHDREHGKSWQPIPLICFEKLNQKERG